MHLLSKINQFFHQRIVMFCDQIVLHFIHQVVMASRPFDLQVKLPPANLSTTHGGDFTLSH